MIITWISLVQAVAMRPDEFAPTLCLIKVNLHKFILRNTLYNGATVGKLK